MGTIRNFEDLIAWQKARALAKRVYQLTEGGPFSRDWALRDQLRRASISIISNIAEGFERGRAGEFYQFLSIAKGSCAELRAQLYIVLDVGYIDPATFGPLMQEVVELGRVLGGLRASVRRRRDAQRS